MSCQYISLTNSLHTEDIISTTCEQCASRSVVLNYTFCLSSLQTVPIAPAANLPELAAIVMKLAKENATATISTIQNMMSIDKFDPFAKVCLGDCLELYQDGVLTLADAGDALLKEQFVNANVLISGVMEAPVTCEEGFTEKEGEVTPLTKENYNFFELNDIALCIINLLSSGSAFI